MKPNLLRNDASIFLGALAAVPGLILLLGPVSKTERLGCFALISLSVVVLASVSWKYYLNQRAAQKAPPLGEYLLFLFDEETRIALIAHTGLKDAIEKNTLRYYRWPKGSIQIVDPDSSKGYEPGRVKVTGTPEMRNVTVVRPRLK